MSDTFKISLNITFNFRFYTFTYLCTWLRTSSQWCIKWGASF